MGPASVGIGVPVEEAPNDVMGSGRVLVRRDPGGAFLSVNGQGTGKQRTARIVARSERLLVGVGKKDLQAILRV